MSRISEEQGGGSGSYYKLMKLDYLLPSWESFIILDKGAANRKDVFLHSTKTVSALHFSIYPASVT